MSEQTAEALRKALVHHFGARDVTVREERDGRYRITSAEMDWRAAPVGGIPVDLYEVAELPESYSVTSARPLLALASGDHSWLLNEEAGFAGFVKELGERVPEVALARLATHLFGRGMERPLLPDDLTPAGLAALTAANAVPYEPRREKLASGGWQLLFLAAAAADRTVGGKVALNLREWTLRVNPGDGVDWQARPLAIGVTGAVR